MKKLALSFLLCSAAAFATTVTYTTSGIFTSSGTNAVTNGGATLTFTDISTPSTVNATTFSSLGVVTETGGSPQGTFSDTFTLTITQSVPAPGGSASSSSSVMGTVTVNSSTITLTFVPADVTIGTGASAIDYHFLNGSYGLNNPSGGDPGLLGRTSIQADIIAMPEPASLGLIGMSLLGLGVLVRRRAKK